MRRGLQITLPALVACLAGCTGVLSTGSGEGGPNGQGSGNGDGDDNTGELEYDPPSAASAALQARTWKLSNEQYRRSVEAFLGVPVSLHDESGTARLQDEVNSGVFHNLALSGFVSVALADDYYRVAEEITDALTAEQLTALSPCGQTDATCRDDFIASAIQKAFRRPARAEDQARFAALFDLAEANAEALADPAAGYRNTLRALLTSPHFLYRTEIGDDPEQQDFTLSEFEVASFLSYSILDEPPDAELMGAAARGELAQAESLGAIIADLLKRPAATAQLTKFMLEWLEIGEFDDPEIVRKDLAAFEDVRGAMLDETLSFLAEHAGMDGSLRDFLISPVPLPSGPLGAFYMSEASSANADLNRTGVLSLGTILSTNSKEGATSPTLRGVFIRERILCQDLAAPPVIPDIGEVAEREQPQTTRELYELHASIPSCAGCHSEIDGVGMTFESLDEMGRFRSAQNGIPIDTSGELVSTDVDVPVLQNHTQLAEALAESDWVRECLSRQAFRFYFGLASSAVRSENGTREREDRGLPPIVAGLDTLRSDGTMSDLLGAILSSPSTLLRTRLEPEAKDL